MIRDDLRGNSAILTAKRTPDLRAADRFGPESTTTSQHENLAGLAQWFVDREQQPCFIIDEALRVLLMNAPAERLLMTTPLVVVSAGKLSIEKARARVELTRILSGRKDSATFAVRVAGVPLSVSVCRVGTLNARGMLILRVRSAGSSDSHRLRAELGLSRAEAEVALEIFKGMSLVAVARSRGASINTVKTQTRSLFQKCKVHSQVSLARRIGEVLAREAAPAGLG